ncbi:MAG: DUF1351 domain-containing protein [Treponema sp.]
METKELSTEITTELSLIVKELTIGKLVTNAIDIKAFVAEKLKEYSVENYPHGAKQAAKDRATLNASAKKLNDDRIALERKWNKPFQEFKDIVSETTDMIKDASGKLDAIVKAKEEEEKAEKKQAVIKIWDKKNFTLVPLVRIFNPKWLNKTYKIATVEADIDNLIQTITGDLAALEGFGEDAQTLKELYLSTLNLQQALNKGAELKANRERLRSVATSSTGHNGNAARNEFSSENSECKAQEERLRAVAASSAGHNENAACDNSTGAIPQDKEVCAREAAKSETTESKANESEAEGAETIDITPSESEREAVRPVGIPPIPAEKTYTFHVVGTEEDIEQVREIAAEMNLSSPPSLTLNATAAQVEEFKKRLAHSMMGYKKVGNPSLYVEDMQF